MKRRKQNKNLLVIVLVALLLTIVLIKFISNKNKLSKENDSANIVGLSVKDDSINELADKAELEKIKSMNERTRIEYYVSKFMKLIENQDYSTAYSLLNVDYKQNYFETEAQFKEYCEGIMPDMPDIQYSNFERNGDVYVVWVTITDTLNGIKNQGKEISFVVKENGFNDYELSFSK